MALSKTHKSPSRLLVFSLTATFLTFLTQPQVTTFHHDHRGGENPHIHAHRETHAHHPAYHHPHNGHDSHPRAHADHHSASSPSAVTLSAVFAGSGHWHIVTSVVPSLACHSDAWNTALSVQTFVRQVSRPFLASSLAQYQPRAPPFRLLSSQSH